MIGHPALGSCDYEPAVLRVRRPRAARWCAKRPRRASPRSALPTHRGRLTGGETTYRTALVTRR
jgi:hypothetical protein